MIRAAVSVKPKPKRCKVCRTLFDKRSMAHIACSPKCALELAAAAREKKAKADYKVRKNKLKSLSDHKADAQVWVNRYVRLRDADLPCISCGRFHQGQWHAGHYKSVGAHPELRFAADLNIHKQCQPCNTSKSGNVLEYRKGLIAKIGIDNVERLEGPHPAAHYTEEDCKRIAAEYKAKIKELEAGKKPAGVSVN